MSTEAQSRPVLVVRPSFSRSLLLGATPVLAALAFAALVRGEPLD